MPKSRSGPPLDDNQFTQVGRPTADATMASQAVSVIASPVSIDRSEWLLRNCHPLRLLVQQISAEPVEASPGINKRA